MTTTEAANGADDIIVCRDVNKWFGDFHALKGITTSVARSEKVVILGPSGSGKSTFIRTINRLEEHQKGDIISGRSPSDQRRAEHRRHPP